MAHAANSLDKPLWRTAPDPSGWWIAEIGRGRGICSIRGLSSGFDRGENTRAAALLRGRFGNCAALPRGGRATTAAMARCNAHRAKAQKSDFRAASLRQKAGALISPVNSAWTQQS